MTGAMLTEPVSPGSHAGLLFMNAGGYAPLSVHGVIAATTIAIERRLLDPGGDGRTVVYDTMAGVIRARAHINGAGKGRARQRSVGAVVRAACRAVGPGRGPPDSRGRGVWRRVLRGRGRRIDRPVDRGRHTCPLFVTPAAKSSAPSRLSSDVAHPLDAKTEGLFGTLFTGPASRCGCPSESRRRPFRRRSRPFAIGHRNGRGHGRSRRHGTARGGRELRSGRTARSAVQRSRHRAHRGR